MKEPRRLPPPFDNYLVYADGRIWSEVSRGGRKGAWLRQYRMRTGYVDVLTSKDGVKRRLLVHRAVAMSYIPNPENKPCVNHKNGVKSDNRATNLEWVTYSENIRHADATGLRRHPKGEKAYHKLTEEQVRIIRTNPTANMSEMARRFGVNPATVRSVRCGLNWKHIVA